MFTVSSSNMQATGRPSKNRLARPSQSMATMQVHVCTAFGAHRGNDAMNIYTLLLISGGGSSFHRYRSSLRTYCHNVSFRRCDGQRARDATHGYRRRRRRPQCLCREATRRVCASGDGSQAESSLKATTDSHSCGSICEFYGTSGYPQMTDDTPPACAVHCSPRPDNHGYLHTDHILATALSLRICLDRWCLPTCQRRFRTNMGQRLRHLGSEACHTCSSGALCWL